MSSSANAGGGVLRDGIVQRRHIVAGRVQYGQFWQHVDQPVAVNAVGLAWRHERRGRAGLGVCRRFGQLGLPFLGQSVDVIGMYLDVPADQQRSRIVQNEPAAPGKPRPGIDTDAVQGCRTKICRHHGRGRCAESEARRTG